jgi:indolepyruvate decarboxylase
MASPLSVGKYLLDQLYRHGVRHIFGVPGDYVLGFYQMIEESPIEVIGTTREDAAGFAADAYARIRGLGAACVTYCVGGLSLANSTACAYAEKSPVIVIGGAPDLKGRERHPLLHHLVRDFRTQYEVFSRLTVASASLDDLYTAYDEIDRVIHAVERYKRPGYIELPRDLVREAHRHQHRDQTLEELTDEDALAECMAEVVAMLDEAERPVILAGEEVHRFGLQDELLQLVEKMNVPVATTILGKSILGETHPLHLGVYAGAMGRDEVREYVESADCLLMLGCFMTDINLGVFTARLDPNRAISATSEKTSVRRHSFEGVPFQAFIATLLGARLRRRRKPEMPARPTAKAPRLRESDPITAATLFAMLNDAITDETAVVSDVGDCLFGAIDLKMHRPTEFLGSAYYSSMGWGVPAALGAQVANPALRPLALVGDGGFQMTGMELSTIARLGLNPVVVVLNNRGYSTERQIIDGPFNDIHNWRFSRVVDVLGAGLGFEAHTVGEMREALQAGAANRDSFTIIEVALDPFDTSPSLRRLGEELGKRARGQQKD